jgi:hypothetical protein
MPRGLRPAVIVAACASLTLAACSEVEEKSSTSYEPSSLSPIKGSDDVQQVTLTAESAARVGLRTAAIRADGRVTVVPSDAVVYDAEGHSYVYTAPKPLSYVRAEVHVTGGDDRTTRLSDGPPAGTQVVTRGAAEVYGTEFEVGH